MRTRLVLLSLMLLGGGACKPVEVEAPRAAARVNPEDVLAPLGAGDDAAVQEAAAKLLRGRASGALAGLARSAQAWAGAGDDGLARLEHLDAVLAATKRMPVDAVVLTPLTRMRVTLVDALRAELAAIDVRIAGAFGELRCEEARRLDERGAALRFGLGEAEPAKRISPERCVAMNGLLAVATAAGDWSTAWEQLHAYQSELGLVTASDPETIHQRGRAFAASLKTLVRAAKSGKPLPFARLEGSEALVDGRGLLLTEPGLRGYLMDEQQRLRDWLAQPRTAAECRAELPLLAWLGRVLDGAPAAKLMPVATALAGTDTALDGALFVGLEKASDGDPDVLLLSASMRQSVAKQHLEVARRNLRQRKFEAVGAAVVSAREVARPGSAILEPLAEVEEALTNELDRQAEALQRATTLKDAFKRWKDVLVLARARSGGAPNPIESIATDAFTAFASDEPEAGLTGLDKLKGSQEVHVLRAREVLVTQAAAWLRPRLARLAKDRNFTASEQILVTLQELRPQDAELTAQLAGVRELAYLQRSERIHQAVRHGHLALGYVLIAKDTALTEADRDALKQRYSAELAQVNQRVLIGGEIVHDGARELAGTSVSGKGWALGPGVASMANRPYFPTTLLLRAAAVRVSEPRQTARRSKTARVRDGVERSENPEKEACAEQIGDAEQDLSRAEAAFAVAETANRECQRAAAASKAPYASIACSGGTVATKIALESIRSKLSNTRSRCSGLPEYVESERWSEREYEVVEWRVEGSAEVELAMLDPSSPAEFGMRRVRAETSATDSSAEAPADLKNVQDELELPSREVLERRLLDDLRRKYEAVCAALVGDYLRMLDDRGEALTGTVRLEVLARLLLLHGKSGINTPKKDSWLRELLASAPVQAGDAEALRRHDAAASRTVASRTVAPGPVVAPAPSTSRQADAADALVASVLAGESSGPTSCGECSDFCAPKARACLAGDSDACLAAAVCTCRCKLSQGGCGEEVAALRRCEAQGGGKPRKAARGKPAP